MTTQLVPQATIDLDAAQIDAMTDAQIGLYFRLAYWCKLAPGSIAQVMHVVVPLFRLQELRRLGLIRCTPGLAWSYVSIVQEGADGAWWRCSNG